MAKLTQEITDDTESYFIRCRCHEHLLNVAVWDDDIGDDEFGSVFLTLYDVDSRYSLWTRIKEAYKLIRRGTGGGSDIVLHGDDAFELGSILKEMSEKLKGPKENA